MISVNINMMGIFQDYFSECLIIDIPDGTSIFFLKDILINNFSNNSLNNFNYLIKNSLFSNNSNILSDDYVLSHNEVIYLLPPFSGG